MNPATSHPNLFQLSLWVSRYALRRAGWLVAVLGSMLIKILFEVLKPWPVLFLIDYILNQRAVPASWRNWIEILPGAPATEAMIGWTIVATLLIFLLGWAANLANGFCGISLGQRMVYDLAADLFARLQQLSLRFHTRKSVGDNIRRVTSDCACVSTITKDALIPVVSALASVVVMFGIMWRLSPSLTLLALTVVPYMMWVFWRFAGPMLELSYREQEVESGIYSLFEQTFTAMPIVQAFGREDLNSRRLREANRQTMAATLALTGVQIRFKIFMGLATAGGTAAIFWLGSRQALSGEVTVGTIILFLSYLASLYAPIETVMYTSATIQSAGGSARRVWEVLRTKREVKDAPGAMDLTETRGGVAFEGVTCGYESGRPVLHDLNLKVSSGQTVALVGATGAGKSTLVSLVLRFLDPWEGRVVLDGTDVRQVTLRSLRRHIALVLQEPFLFPLSIAENISYGRPDATMAEIEAAARAARVHEFIQSLPQGYATPVGERGATLSGGERQRISIARALLKNAPILILDEPTSSLDVETEAALLHALKTFARGKTTFIIAHRLSTIRHADLIVVLEQGRIVEQGNHESLLAAQGHYYRLYERQFGEGSAEGEQGHA